MKIILLEVGTTPKSDHSLQIGKRIAQLVVDDDCVQFEARGIRFYLRGDFYYVRGEDATEALQRETLAGKLKQVMELRGPAEFQRCVEGEYFCVGLDGRTAEITTFGDLFNRRPLFYSTMNGGFIASDYLPDVVEGGSDGTYDQRSLYSYLLLGYAPGRDTFYTGVSKLAADETLVLSATGVSTPRVSHSVAIREYDRNDMARYDAIIRNAVHTRSSETVNVVMNSGGWDSTSLVYLLKEIHGSGKVQSIVMDLHLADGQSFNVYEVDKVRRISEYYGVSTDTCVIDYASTGPLDVWERSLKTMRESHTYYWVNHMQLAEQIAGSAVKNTAVFSGEASDSVHNFGFSQWVSVNYDDMDLREIADKAKTYLYGPTFFGKLQTNQFRDDKVYQFFQHYYGTGRFTQTDGLESDELRLRYFEAFALSYPRVPFASWQNETLVNSAHASSFQRTLRADYFDEAARVATPDTLYYHLLQVYRRFHFQSAQIGISHVALASHGYSCRMPFLDLQMYEFMCSMPENWGRGLELRPTKYPLRYLANERWDMPLHILEEEGPHSYIAENDKKWTYSGGQWDIYCEILYNSVFSDYFRAKLESTRIEAVFDPSCFNVRFMQGVIDDYVMGKQDIPHHGMLFKLAVLFSVGLLD